MTAGNFSWPGTLRSSRLVHFALLAVPFVAVAVGSGGLKHTFHVYQSYDELTHFYDGVQMAAHAWPRLVTTGYGSWSGPLVYWLLAGLSRPFTSTLESVRVVVMVMSWATCVAAYVLFRDGLRARPPVALTFAFILLLSPFFFGESFYVLTDNPTWLFVVLSLLGLVAWVRMPELWRFALAIACASVASLMRQVAVWLYLASLGCDRLGRVPAATQGPRGHVDRRRLRSARSPASELGRPAPVGCSAGGADGSRGCRASF